MRLRRDDETGVVTVHLERDEAHKIVLDLAGQLATQVVEGDPNMYSTEKDVPVVISVDTGDEDG